MKCFSKLIMTLMISFTLMAVPVYRAEAVMISTEQVLREESYRQLRAMNEAKVKAFLSRDEVKAELTKLGVKPEEASLRVASLSDEELQNAAIQIDQQVAGSGIVIGLLTIVVLVLLIIFLAKRI